MSLLDKDSDTGLVDPLHGQEEEEWWDTRGQRAVIGKQLQTIKADWSPVHGSSFVNWCFCDKMCFQTDIVYKLCIVCMRFLTFNKQIIKQDVVLLLASILPQVHKEIPS